MDPASLDNLHDIVVLAPVPWWPPAPGWYLLGFLLLITIVLGVLFLGRRWHANRYRRAALAELDRLQVLGLDGPRRKGAVREISELVKRVALAAWPRNRVATLSGQEWLEFLDSTGHTKVFTDGPGRLLPALAYRPQTADSLAQPQIHELIVVVKTWIKKHQANGPTDLK